MTETNAAMTAGTEIGPVTVSMSELNEGIGTVFAGVMTMLQALDNGTLKKVMEAVDQSVTESARTPDPGVAASSAGSNTTEKQSAAEDTAPAVIEKGCAQDPAQVAAGITQDDITKIIVQKLKKDRTNNEKIGAILKAYGLSKVSDLPENKYESFLTDLSQL